MTGNFWFTGGLSLARIEVYAVVAFVLTIFLIRVLGKRTISKMNPSDFVMLVLQHVSEWLSTRSKIVRALSEGAPTLLVDQGRTLPEHMRRENVKEEELHSALREQGIASIDDALAETH